MHITLHSQIVGLTFLSILYNNIAIVCILKSIVKTAEILGISMEISYSVFLSIRILVTSSRIILLYF